MTTTALLDRAETSTDARAGRELFAFRSSSDLVDRIELAKGGSTRISGVPIFKEGSFHGGAFTVDAIEIAAMVERFGQLYPDVFVPPVRVDHGWSARDVIGWIEGLSTATLPDPSDGGREKTYLLADFEIVDPEALEQIRSRKLRNRSSEIGGYETNNGSAYPLIVWGVAFVDIPAVEGLGDVKLRAHDPAKVTELTEGSSMEPENATDPTEPTTESGAPVEATPPEGDGTATEEAIERVEETGSDTTQDLGEDVVDEPLGSETETTTSEGTDAGDAEAPAEAPGGGPADNVEQLRASGDRIAALRAAGFDAEADEIERLRTERLERELERFSERGVIVPANRESARELLSHQSPTVVLAATRLLESFRPPVELGERAPQEAPDHSLGGSRTKSGLVPGMTAEEGGALWASLTTEQRKDPEYVAEYEAWRLALPSRASAS